MKRFFGIPACIFLALFSGCPALRADGGSRASDIPSGTQSAQGTSFSLTAPPESFGHSILHPQDPFQVVPGKDPDGWSFTLEPYLWAIGMSGDVGVKGLPAVHLDYNAKTILQHLDWGLMARGEIRKGRWGILGDGLFAQLSAAGNPPGPLYENAGLRFQQGLASLALAFRLIDDRRGFLDVYAGARYNYLGINLGARVDSEGVQNLSDTVAERIGNGISQRMDDFLANNAGALASVIVNNVAPVLTDKLLLKTADFVEEFRGTVSRKELLRIMRELQSNSGSYRELLFASAQARAAAAKNQLTPAVQNRLTNARQNFARALARKIENVLPTSVEGSRWWVDPIVGLRGQINFTRWLFLAAQGDAGGFYAGSKIAWNVQASLGVNFTRNIFGEIGYRYYYMDYSNGGTLYNGAESGIFSGVGVKF